MSIQWTIAASFLYFEIGVVLLLVLPVASPRRWQKVFKSRFLAVLGSQTQIYFYILLFTLALLLLDAIREMRKYNSSDVKDTQSGVHSEMQLNMRLFRAQRNFYISGFALFLSLVIRRLVTSISSLATMQAESEASLKQAQNAATTARKLLSQTGELSENAANEAHDKEVNSLKKEISELKKNLEKEKLDKEALKTQTKATNAEYDRLTEEYSKLQKKVAAEGNSDKKDD